jgi:hypothetical protein
VTIPNCLNNRLLIPVILSGCVLTGILIGLLIGVSVHEGACVEPVKQATGNGRFRGETVIGDEKRYSGF